MLSSFQDQNVVLKIWFISWRSRPILSVLNQAHLNMGLSGYTQKRLNLEQQNARGLHDALLVSKPLSLTKVRRADQWQRHI